MTDKTLPADALCDELIKIVEYARAVARDAARAAGEEAFERAGGEAARVLLSTYFPSEYESWACNADSPPVPATPAGDDDAHPF